MFQLVQVLNAELKKWCSTFLLLWISTHPPWITGVLVYCSMYHVFWYIVQRTTDNLFHSIQRRVLTPGTWFPLRFCWLTMSSSDLECQPPLPACWKCKTSLPAFHLLNKDLHFDRVLQCLLWEWMFEKPWFKQEFLHPGCTWESTWGLSKISMCSPPNPKPIKLESLGVAPGICIFWKLLDDIPIYYLRVQSDTWRWVRRVKWQKSY